MTANKKDIQILLQNTEKIVNKEKEIRRIKGEDFNLFRIMGMQTDEVKTHSSMIAELLNPKGTHYMGEIFLRIFMDIIKLNSFVADENAVVEVEKYIGKVDLINNKGGQIDIFLEDANGNTVVIENKIYAKDQKKQLVRYKNYKKNKHTVIYLNLFGEKPNDVSVEINNDKKLILNKDYQIISYKEHISRWLEKCEEKATSKPILRESIKQYRILINQLTNNMDETQKKELTVEISRYLEEAKFINDHYKEVISEIQDGFRKKVLKELKQKLEKKYLCETGADITNKYAQIWINYDGNTRENLHFGVETFNGDARARGGVLFVGVKSVHGNVSDELKQQITQNERLDRWWPVHKKLKFDNKIINLSEPKFLKIILNDHNGKFLKSVSDQIVDFVYANEERIINTDK